MATDPLEEDEIKRKIDECTVFLEQTLRPQLACHEEREMAVRMEMKEYTDLAHQLEDMIVSPRDVDLGYRKVFTKAIIEDPSKVFVHVGMGFHVELTLQEAGKFVSERVQFLSSQVLPKRTRQSENIRKHVKETEMILDALSAELIHSS